ncbi:4Fe-4S binding protein [Parvibacter caecicola]|uniref:4Fe-4S binding protein n=1 Tax=Parvibacter caecicola TaxID=747645 RepID=UPI002731EEB6|nr:4Fe-4S binding protein [Parvibacter caecicola]
MHQFATSRPDSTDGLKLGEFAKAITEQLQSGTAATQPRIPGNRPYVKGGAVPLVPKVTGQCVSCGACAKSCPVTAINTVDFSADKSLCIACMRCVETCPQNARSISKIMVKAASMAIKKAASQRKECELYL